MKYMLYKFSSPGFEKKFSSEEELKKELYSYICNMCRQGDEELEEDPVTEDSSLDAMLWCPCGCEFGYEEVE